MRQAVGRRRLALLVSPIVGCQGESWPELIVVEGGVSLHGQPLTAGSVSFRAEDAGSRFWPSGTIDSNGRYRLYVRKHEGCPPGSYRVVVFANQPVAAGAEAGNAGLPRSIIDRKYNNPETTPLRVEVRAAVPAGQYDLRIE